MCVWVHIIIIIIITLVMIPPCRFDPGTPSDKEEAEKGRKNPTATRVVHKDD